MWGQWRELGRSGAGALKEREQKISEAAALKECVRSWAASLK